MKELTILEIKNLMITNSREDINEALLELAELKAQIEANGYAVGRPENLERYVHSKGGRYLLVTDKNVKIEQNWSDGAAYINAQGGPLIIRNKEEFNDGRFEKVEKEAELFADWSAGGHPPSR